MNFFRRKQNVIKLIWVISLAVFLRSFIAPGYMISASAEDGLGLIFCDGPVSLNIQQDQSSGHHAEHQHHGNNDDEVQQEIHISPICSQWSTSSLLVINTLFNPPFVISTRVKQHTYYQKLILQQAFNNHRDIRGSPYLA